MKRVSGIKHAAAMIAPAIVDISMTINRVVLLAYCNLTLAFIVLILEKGGDHMRRLNRGVIGIALVAMLAIAGWAFNSYAFEGAPGPQHGVMLQKQQMLIKALGITDEQKARMKDILQKYRPELKPLMKQYHVEKRSLRRLVHEGTTDEAAIRAQTVKLSTVEAELAIQRARMIHDMRGVLTQEQLQKLSQMEKDRIDMKNDLMLFRLAGPRKGE